MKAIVSVSYKDGVLDPEAAAIAKSLNGLGYDQVRAVKRVRRFELELEAQNAEEARGAVTKMCDDLLANPVIETYSVELA